MAQIKSEAAYRAALKRIDALLSITGDDASRFDPNLLELEMLSDMVYEYEQIHYPINSHICSLKIAAQKRSFFRNKETACRDYAMRIQG